MNEDKSVRYHRLKRRGAVLSLALDAAFLTVLLASGFSTLLRHAAGGANQEASSPLTVALYVLLVACVHEIITGPLAFYRIFLLERRYGLSTESGAAWMVDHAKALAISAAVALGGAEIVYLTIRLSPAWWWLFSALAFVAATIGIAKIAPVVLMPVFYRFKPLERQALRSRLESLSVRAGVPVLGVYEWGLGDKTRRANAALVGTGRTRRILVSNTLLAHYTDDEIEVILAHEIGHHVHRDIAIGLAIEGALLACGFYASARVLAAFWRPLGLASPGDVAGLPILLLVAGALSVLATPLVNAISRSNERRADRFALNVTQRPAAFVSAMRRLATQNMAEQHPSPAVLWLFHTHPPIDQRIAAAKALE